MGGTYHYRAGTPSYYHQRFSPVLLYCSSTRLPCQTECGGSLHRYFNIPRVAGQDDAEGAWPDVDQHQQQKIDEAAEEFAAAVRECYQALADRGVSAQELNSELTQKFFDKVIENLRTQEEATQVLAQESVEPTWTS
jgi:hypothetical protein